MKPALLTNNECPRIKLVLWTGLGGDQPGQRSAFFTVLVLHEAPNLSVVRLPVFLICYLDDVSCLVVNTLQVKTESKHTQLEYDAKKNKKTTLSSRE